MIFKDNGQEFGTEYAMFKSAIRAELAKPAADRDWTDFDLPGGQLSAMRQMVTLELNMRWLQRPTALQEAKDRAVAFHNECFGNMLNKIEEDHR